MICLVKISDLEDEQSALNNVEVTWFCWDTSVRQITCEVFIYMFICCLTGGNVLQRLTDSFIMVQNMQMQPQNICLWQQLHKCHTLLPEGQFHSCFRQKWAEQKNRPKPDLTWIKFNLTQHLHFIWNCLYICYAVLS